MLASAKQNKGGGEVAQCKKCNMVNQRLKRLKVKMESEGQVLPDVMSCEGRCVHV